MSEDRHPQPGYVTLETAARRLNYTNMTVSRWLVQEAYEGCWFKDAKGRLNIDFKKLKEVYESVQTQKQKEIKINSEDDGGKAKDTYVQARTGNEVAKLKMQKLKIAEMEGSLVSAEKVKADSFLFARSIRDQLLSIPDRLSPILAAEKDERKIYIRLQDEIKLALSEVLKLLGDSDDRSK